MLFFLSMQELWVLHPPRAAGAASPAGTGLPVTTEILPSLGRLPQPKGKIPWGLSSGLSSEPGIEF